MRPGSYGRERKQGRGLTISTAEKTWIKYENLKQKKVKELLMQLKDTAYDADDLLHESGWQKAPRDSCHGYLVCSLLHSRGNLVAQLVQQIASIISDVLESHQQLLHSPFHLLIFDPHISGCADEELRPPIKKESLAGVDQIQLVAAPKTVGLRNRRPSQPGSQHLEAVSIGHISSSPAQRGEGTSIRRGKTFTATDRSRSVASIIGDWLARY
ncbi:hypothetical protein BHM03_00028657 [Ensete ventricosum]|uniref:Uncharacterized protein n=1 Tax=Ensete ventricosum TaxID=4639 RepID=A0A445MHV3_ENSVE|nr:hypothetical protein BHM03_00028657 [Ensete ventricosum]